MVTAHVPATVTWSDDEKNYTRTCTHSKTLCLRQLLQGRYLLHCKYKDTMLSLYISQLCHTIGPADTNWQVLCQSNTTRPMHTPLHRFLSADTAHNVDTSETSSSLTRASWPQCGCSPAGMVYVTSYIPFVGCINVVVFVQGKEIQPQPLLWILLFTSICNTRQCRWDIHEHMHVRTSMSFSILTCHWPPYHFTSILHHQFSCG